MKDINPQAEDGHTDIANEIMEALAKIRISGEARQVLDLILRKTYGWHKKWDKISLSQFTSGTGLKKSTICKALNKLIFMNLIITKKDNEGISKYMFNKHYDKWKPLPKKITLPKKEISITQKGNESLPKKRHTKETIQKKLLQKKYSLQNLFSKIESKFTEEELKHKQEFLDYWKEKSEGGLEERWQCQKFFDVSRRFRTWLKNRGKWGINAPKEKPKTDSAVIKEYNKKQEKL